MLVIERMSTTPVTITGDLTVTQALEVIERRNVHHLPVVNDRGALVGIITERDLLRAKGNEVVDNLMERRVITVTEYTPLENAARIMADHKIGSLPVMRDGKIVGIITQTDLFKVFLELLGARESGVRLTMLVPEERGILAKLTAEIADLGGNILALSTFMGEDPSNRIITVKVEHVSQEKLVAIMEAMGMEIVDVREA
jgi:acetoin utilization protein AcuB